MRVSSLFGVAAWLGATGCDPIMKTSGHVRAVPEACASGGSVGAAGRPLEDAAIKLDCGGGARELGKTDALGRFEHTSVGFLGTHCVVVVEKAGYLPQSHPADALCVARRGDSCHFMRVDAELVPAEP